MKKVEFEEKARLAAHYMSFHGPDKMGDSRSIHKAMEVGFYNGAVWARDHANLELMKLRTHVKKMAQAAEKLKLLIEDQESDG